MMLRFVAIVMMCLPATLFAAGKIYTWTDENGETHFGDRPPTQANAQEVAIQGKKRIALEIAEEQLPGQWFGSGNDGGEVRITLNASGTVNFLQTKGDQSLYNYQGIWTLENTTLTVITEFSQTAPPNGQMKRSVEPVQITYTIIGFTGDTMELISQDERFNVNRVN